jgi:hypothetical protein
VKLAERNPFVFEPPLEVVYPARRGVEETFFEISEFFFQSGGPVRGGIVNACGNASHHLYDTRTDFSQRALEPRRSDSTATAAVP